MENRQNSIENGTRDPIHYKAHVKCVSIGGTEEPEQPVLVSDSLYISYRDNFTIHGLSRVFTGKLWESFVWAIMLLACLTFVGYATVGFVNEYRSFKVQTDIQTKSAKGITLPSITLCAADPLAMACHENVNFHKSPCYDIHTDMYKLVFHDDRRYIATHPEFPDSCIIVNPHGNLTKINLRFYIGNLLDYSPKPSVYVHDHQDMGFVFREEQKFSLYLVNNYCSNVRLTNKQLVSRLPKPYQTMCDQDKETKNIFPGPCLSKSVRTLVYSGECILNVVM